jgi:hypothetical protein
MTTPNNKVQYLEFQTAHYNFQLTLKETTNKYYRGFYFFVGNKEDPCLEGDIRLECLINNIRYKESEYTAFFHKINALTECAQNDITDEYLQKYSFGQELLDAIVFYMNAKFNKINNVRLVDTSYIPCGRKNQDQLDLLTYSIALYKKTWYEERLNAYMLPNENYINYRRQVEIYASKETKNNMPFDLFLEIHLRNEYSKDIIYNNYDLYENLYKISETFPEFFQKISRTIQRENKCKFFKGWLEKFIANYVSLGDRVWYFNLYPKIKAIQQSNMRPIRNKTRRQRNN